MSAVGGDSCTDKSLFQSSSEGDAPPWCREAAALEAALSGFLLLESNFVMTLNFLSFLNLSVFHMTQ